jgi:hypothetical protein
MRNIVILFALSCFPAFGAACNPGSTAGCAALVCNGATSGATALASTNYTTTINGQSVTIPGITQICGQTYETSPNTFKFDCAWPTTGSSNKIIDYRPSGGWQPANRNSFYTSTIGLILMAQSTNATVCTHDSPSTNPSTPWPAQAQADRQFLYWLVADAGATVPGDRYKIWEIGDSSSAHLAGIQLYTQGQTTPWSDSGNNTATNAYNIVGAALMYVPFCIADVAGCTYTNVQQSADIINTLTLTVNAGGSGYVTGDIVAPTYSGCVGTQFKVTASGGAVTSFSVINPGTGCTPNTAQQTAVATTAITGSGSGFKGNITFGQNYNGTAFRLLTNCSEWNISCEQSFDATNKLSLTQWTKSTNPNVLKPLLLISGYNDQVVPNNQLAPLLPGSIGTPMNSAAALPTLYSLGTPVLNLVYPGDHEAAMQTGSAGVGINCSQVWPCGPQQDVINFINNGTLPTPIF